MRRVTDSDFAIDYVIGIDIGGTNSRFGAISKDKKILAYAQYSTPEIFDGVSDPVSKLEKCIRSFAADYMDGIRPASVSIGFPSTLNHERTVIMQTPNIASIPDNLPVTEPLGEKLGIPVFINRDVNNLLLFDIEDLGLSSYENVCGIYYGTGVGNSVMVNGRILLGKNGVASELGHLPIPNNDKICTCGNTGCLETLVSGVALEKIQKDEFPDTFIGDIFAEKKDTPVIREFLENMSRVVAVEENLFDPECVIIGGGLPQMKGFPKEDFEKYAHFFTRKPYPEKTMTIRYSRPDQKNGVIGAAIYAEKRIKDPTYL